MTDDLEVALSEGSTMVRLGRALFGDRPPREARRPGAGPAGARRGPLTGDDGHPPVRQATHYAVTEEETMAASFMKKTMAYLGLVDDDYDDYDDYESRSPAPVGRVGQRSPSVAEAPEEPAVTAPSPRIRTLTRDETSGTAVAAAPTGSGPGRA